jgi:hypothetical protein
LLASIVTWLDTWHIFLFEWGRGIHEDKKTWFACFTVLFCSNVQKCLNYHYRLKVWDYNKYWYN